jgi:transposase
MGSDSHPDLQSQLFADVLRLSLIEGRSARAIARQLSLSRNTVRKMLQARPGGGPTRPAAAPRSSILAPFEAELRRCLDDEPTIKAPAVLERLRKLGYQGGLTIVRDRIRKLRPRPKAEAFLTLDFLPGAAVQVDWADFGFALPGCARRVSALIMALCYSRYLYLEFTLSQQFGTFVRALERGLRSFGGTTTVDIFDNMKTVVTSRPAGVAVFNHRFLDYATCRGFGVVACTPRKPNQKGRVERPVGFVRERFWPGRRFTSLLDLNRQAREWLDEFANTRTHEQTGKVPTLVFEHEEQRLLRPLTSQPFDADDRLTTQVTKLFRVRFDRNTYSVPPRLVSQTVLVRADDEQVAVFLGPKQVAVHQRCWGVGEDIEHPSHRQRALAGRPDRQVLPPGLAGLGEVGLTYLKIMAASRRSIRREILRLTFLCEIFGAAQTASAMREVMQTGHVGNEYVEYVLRHKRRLAPQAPPLRLGRPEFDSLAFAEPDLSAYDDLVSSPKTLDPGPPPAVLDAEAPHEEP